jgi:hypothetical protein
MVAFTFRRIKRLNHINSGCILRYLGEVEEASSHEKKAKG